MRRLLITGGSGYLGRALIARAAAAGYECVATRHAQAPPDSQAAWHRLDLRDPGAPAQLIDAVRPDAVIHTAYVQSGADLHAITAAGAGAMARAAHAAGARFIHLSSDAIFDGEQASPYVEDDLPRPVHPYGAAKAEAERLVSAANPGATIVRTSLIYGGATPGPHEQLVFDALDGRADVTFFTDEMRCPIAVGDLADALIELIDIAHTGPLHIAGAEIISRYEFACAVAAAAGRDPGMLRSGSSAASGLRRPRNCALSIALAQKLLRTPLRGVHAVLNERTRAEEATNGTDT
jgi:dTDP-4-dehydrorhamnose reductase